MTSFALSGGGRQTKDTLEDAMRYRMDWLAALLAGVILLGGVMYGQEEPDAKLALMELRIANAEKRAEAAEKRLVEVEKRSKPTKAQTVALERESFATMWRDARVKAIAGCKDAKGRGVATLTDGKLTYSCSW